VSIISGPFDLVKGYSPLLGAAHAQHENDEMLLLVIQFILSLSLGSVIVLSKPFTISSLVSEKRQK
jgi:hypothetical protein